MALAAAGLLGFRVGATTLDGHEAHVALTPRTMLDDQAWLVPGALPQAPPPRTPCNRWLVPVENGRPRLVKTPLMYWLVAADIVGPRGGVYYRQEPDATVVFYVGRDVPGAGWLREVWSARLGRAEGRERYERWLRDARRVRWLIGSENDARALAGLGFRPACHGTALESGVKLHVLYGRLADPAGLLRSPPG